MLAGNLFASRIEYFFTISTAFSLPQDELEHIQKEWLIKLVYFKISCQSYLDGINKITNEKYLQSRWLTSESIFEPLGVSNMNRES
jgi:hypothetical protein